MTDKEIMYQKLASSFSGGCEKLKVENAKLKNENSKLKAEGDSIETSSIKYYNLYKEALEQIARLKEQVEVKDNNFELYCDLVDENERLYAELGKLGWNR